MKTKFVWWWNFKIDSRKRNYYPYSDYCGFYAVYRQNTKLYRFNGDNITGFFFDNVIKNNTQRGLSLYFVDVAPITVNGLNFLRPLDRKTVWPQIEMPYPFIYYLWFFRAVTRHAGKTQGPRGRYRSKPMKTCLAFWQCLTDNLWPTSDRNRRPLYGACVCTYLDSFVRIKILDFVLYPVEFIQVI